MKLSMPADARFSSTWHKPSSCVRWFSRRSRPLLSPKLGSSLLCRYIVHHRNEISLLPRLGLTQTYLCRRLTSVNPSQRLLAILAREVLFSCVADREISTVTHAYDGRTLAGC